MAASQLSNSIHCSFWREILQRRNVSAEVSLATLHTMLQVAWPSAIHLQMSTAWTMFFTLKKQIAKEMQLMAG